VRIKLRRKNETLLKSVFCSLAIILIFIGGSLSGFAGTEHPFGLNKNHPYGILTSEYESPHVKWAKPYAGGDIKTLVMAPIWSQRETVELAQRLSLDYTPWMTSAFSEVITPDQWFQLKTPAGLIDRLLKKYLSTDYDVIVIGKLEWAALPALHRFELLKNISKGTGLVYINPPKDNKEIDLVFSRKAAPQGDKFIIKGIPFAFLPQFKDLKVADIVKAGFFGKGRVVALDYGQPKPVEKKNNKGFISVAAGYPALTPQWDTSDNKDGYVAPDDCPEAEFIPYEYYQALVARAVIWASGKAPENNLKITIPATIDYPASGYKVKVNADSISEQSRLIAKVRSRYEYGRVYDLPVQPAGSKQLSLPAIPAGVYIMDVWLVDSKGNTIDWSSKGFTVKADINITEIVLSDRNFDKGDKINGEVALSQMLSSEEFVIAELWDNYGRKISEKQLAGKGKKHSFSFVNARPLVIMHKVVVKVVRQKDVVCISQIEFPVRAHLTKHKFNEIIWSGTKNQFLSHLMLRKLSQQDQADAIDIGFAGATDARNVATANLATVPYTARYGRLGGNANVVPVKSKGRGCMSNPETLKAIDKWGESKSNIYGPYGPLSWTHGDESNYSAEPNVCWSDTCLEAFRTYLRGVYTKLAALNKEWNTKYKTWDEVMPSTYETAVKTGNYAPWIEHRLAQELVFAKFYQHTGKALSAHDSNAHVGFDGPMGFAMPNSGINWWLLKDYVGAMHSYIRNSEEMEIFRSFATPKHITGMWYGTYGLTWQIGPNTVEYHHFFPWYTIFHGLNSTWFWTMGQPGPSNGYAPDFTNKPFMQASRDALKEIKTGISTLLLSCKLQDDDIAIHYSDSSKIADSIYSGIVEIKQAGVELGKRPIATAWKDSLTDFNKALEHCGLQYKYIAYAEIEQNALLNRKYKVFIMPHSRVVTAAEAKAIRKFVHNGGLLIADILPGMQNGHGTKQDKSMLADLFPSPQAGKINSIGKGKTVFLGDKLSGYGFAAYKNMAGWKNLKGRHEILAHLLKNEAGLTSQVMISHKETGPMPPTEIFRFRNKTDDAEYVGLMREYFMYDNSAYPAMVKFPRKSHVYDILTGRYLGFKDTIDVNISNKSHLYALLPYKVASISISAPDIVEAGGNIAVVLKVNPEGKVKPIRHVLRVEVIASSGKPLPWYSHNIVAENGSAEYQIDLALNEAPGKYTIQVKDVASGVKEQCIVEVEANDEK